MAFIQTKKTTEQKEVVYNKKSIKEIYIDAQQSGIETMPFDIFEYIKTIQEISYFEDYLDDEISGLMEYYPTRNIYKITLNKYHSSVRRRFTLAHEFGHFFLHRDFLQKEGKIEDRLLFRNGNVNKMEAEANQFAADLLMPEDLFITELKKGNRKISVLASIFQVSYSAIRYRAFKLGYLKEY